MPSHIRVLVVDDSALIRQLLSKALSLDPRIEIVGFARTGAEAIEKALETTPDVITLDIEMPELTGLEALPELARRTDARVLMLSTQDDPDTTYQALSAGAVDFISKPRGGFASSLSDLADDLIKKIKIAYRVNPGRVKSVSSSLRSVTGRAGGAKRADTLDAIVVLAASTGGPPALESVFSGLSASLPAAFLVIQHLPPGFSDSLAKRLERTGEVSFVKAQDGQSLEPGTAYLAPHGLHMRVYSSRGRVARIALEEGSSMHGVCPAADPLFASAAQEFDHVVGVILTGMGRDGVEGLAAIKEAGGQTIVQDEETSVVWGMPGAAVARGVADTVVPLPRVPAEIRRAIRGGVRSRV